jgi:hypothetical protein
VADSEAEYEPDVEMLRDAENVTLSEIVVDGVAVSEAVGE